MRDLACWLHVSPLLPSMLTILIAEFHLLNNTQLLIKLNCSTFQPEGLCQLLTGYCKQLTKTFRSKHSTIKCLSQLCIAQQVKVCYQYQYNYEPLQHHADNMPLASTLVIKSWAQGWCNM